MHIIMHAHIRIIPRSLLFMIIINIKIDIVTVLC